MATAGHKKTDQATERSKTGSRSSTLCTAVGDQASPPRVAPDSALAESNGFGQGCAGYPNNSWTPVLDMGTTISASRYQGALEHEPRFHVLPRIHQGANMAVVNTMAKIIKRPTP